MKYIFNNILKSFLKTSPYIEVGSTTIVSWVYSRIRKKDHCGECYSNFVHLKKMEKNSFYALGLKFSLFYKIPF